MSLSLIFIGHVDSGKSTICGNILHLTGKVDDRTIEKYKREAKDKNRESWYLSWAMDTNAEERDKGKTVEVGRAHFNTKHRTFAILDAPGHKGFVPNMIGAAAQADVAVLVISARKGEFESGFELGGQTREHITLAKTAGVQHLLVAVNKMDDPTVAWQKQRFHEIREKIDRYLKKCGFNDVAYIPLSGINGANIVDSKGCPWYTGPSLLDYLDSLPQPNRKTDAPLRIPIMEKFPGNVVLGKVESGSIKRGQLLTIMPSSDRTNALQLFIDDVEVEECVAGDIITIKLGCDCNVSRGFVLCCENTCRVEKVFTAHISVLDCGSSIICAGYEAVLHIHACTEEMVIRDVIKAEKGMNFIRKGQQAIVSIEVLSGAICLESFNDFPQMGRFSIRNGGKTIAIGKVL
jgi:peptide chain release factor subunit 3